MHRGMVAARRRQERVSDAPERPSLRLGYGYQTWTTAVHLERALRRRAHVSVTGPGHPTERNEHDASGPLLWVESGVPWVPDAEALTQTGAAAWLIDTHRGFRWRAQLARAFDLVFTAQRPAAERLRASGLHAEWLPLAAPRELCGPGADLAARPYDVGFVGQAPAGSFRAELLDDLRRRGVSVAPTPGHMDPPDMMELYRSARVVVNVPLADDLNMRSFEGPGARALLVTEPVPGLGDVLPTGSYVAVEQRDVERWTAAVIDALHDSGAQARADAAYEHVISQHTYDARAAIVVDRLSSIRSTVDPARARAALAVAWARWGRADQIRALALPWPVALQRRADAVAWSAATAVVRASRRFRPQSRRASPASR